MTTGARAKTGKVKVRKAQRKADAFELRARGWSQRQIAAHLGYADNGSVSRLLEEGLREHPAENIELYRAVELAKLDASEKRELEIVDAHMPLARKKIAASAYVVSDAENALAKIRAHRAKLLGLEAPKRAEIVGSDGPVRIEIIHAPVNSNE